MDECLKGTENQRMTMNTTAIEVSKVETSGCVKEK